MKNIAFVFPGQGSQSIGMLADLNVQNPIIKDTFDMASKVLNYDVWELAQTGPVEKLNQTEFAQPILLTAGFAVWQAWQHAGGVQPVLLAGHSLGEYTALVCSEAIAFSDALNLVVKRAQFMQAAVPIGKGAMVAIVGLDENKVLEICKIAATATKQILTPANYNSVGQVVLAGEIKAAEYAIELAKTAGAKIAKMLPMSVPSHCPLMRDAANQLAAILAAIKIQQPKIPVIQNADVKFYAEPNLIRDALVRQLYNPVRWVETIKLIENSAIEQILECGPGKVLTGLNKRIVTNIAVDFLGIPENFKKYLEISVHD